MNKNRFFIRKMNNMEDMNMFLTILQNKLLGIIDLSKYKLCYIPFKRVLRGKIVSTTFIKKYTFQDITSNYDVYIDYTNPLMRNILFGNFVINTQKNVSIKEIDSDTLEYLTFNQNYVLRSISLHDIVCYTF